MKDVDDLDGGMGDAVYNDVVRMHDQLSSTRDSSQSVQVWVLRQLRNRMLNFLKQIQRCQQITFFDIAKNLVEIAACGFKPDYVLHFSGFSLRCVRGLWP